MSVRGNNRARMRRWADGVIGKVGSTMPAEIRAECETMVCLGEDEYRVVLIHGKRYGLISRRARGRGR